MATAPSSRTSSQALSKDSTHQPISSASKVAPETLTAASRNPNEMWEKTALNPCDPEKDQDDWPQLELTNATVKSKEVGNTLEDLLDVRDHGPFEIKGTLSRIPTRLSGIIRRKTIYNSPLVLSNVFTYSIEKLKDGTIKIWALGSCAWYSIQPSEEYMSIFKVMVEKAKLWFFLQEKYEKYLDNNRKIPGTVAQLYSEYTAEESTCATEEVAAELFDIHHRFLLFSMCAAGTGTAMWERTPLFRCYALEYSDELANIQKSANTNHSKSDTSTLPPLMQSRKPPPTQRGSRKARRGNPREKAPEELNDGDEKVPEEPNDGDKKVPEKSNDGDETEEEINVQSPAAIQMPMTPAYDDSDSEDNGPPKRPSSKGKSSLRPSLTLAPPESPGRAESINNKDFGADDDDIDDTSSALPLNRKRAFDDLVSFNIGAPAVKQPRTCADGQFSIPTTAAAGTETSRHGFPSFVSSPQTVGPNQPGGHWECEIDGCRHSILDADAPENLKKIEEHYENHGRVVEKAMEAIGGENLPSRPKYRVK